MILSSPAFHSGSALPVRFTADGDNISPPLRWSGAPKNCASFVLLCVDEEAPMHKRYCWAVYDIPGYFTELQEGAGKPESFEDFRHAVNDFNVFGYRGPSPSRAGAHRFVFSLIALDCASLPIRAHPSCAEVEKEAAKHVIAMARMICA